MLGQSIPFATPGAGDAEGGYGGVGVDLRFGGVTLFVSGDYLSMNDSSSVASGEGGIKIAF